jgi:dTDP-4-dehydrorhamnose reductase
MTFWALLGSFYWDCLVTRDNRTYEPAVFDIHGGLPVPTKLAALVLDLANGWDVPAYAKAGPH